MEFLSEYFVPIVESIFIILIIILVNEIIDGLINKTIDKKENKNVTTMLIFLKRVKKVVLYIIGIVLILFEFNIFNNFSITLLSGLGIGSIVVGLAAQESLKNFFGSIAIVIGNPFDVGDFIECVEKNVSGTVEDITMRHTVIRTINNRRVIIPNSEMNSLLIENFSYSDNALVKTVDYPISYETDIDKAINIIKEELNKIYTISDKAKSKGVKYPEVNVGSWNNTNITLKAWVWGDNNDEVYDNIFKLNYNVKKRFEEEKIAAPYPHINVSEKKSTK